MPVEIHTLGIDSLLELAAARLQSVMLVKGILCGRLGHLGTEFVHLLGHSLGFRKRRNELLTEAHIRRFQVAKLRREPLNLLLSPVELLGVLP